MNTEKRSRGGMDENFGDLSGDFSDGLVGLSKIGWWLCSVTTPGPAVVQIPQSEVTQPPHYCNSHYLY